MFEMTCFGDALLINTKLGVYVKCHRAVCEYTLCAYINFQPSAGHCFVLIITIFTRQPSGMKISKTQSQCRAITSQ